MSLWSRFKAFFRKKSQITILEFHPDYVEGFVLFGISELDAQIIYNTALNMIAIIENKQESKNYILRGNGVVITGMNEIENELTIYTASHVINNDDFSVDSSKDISYIPYTLDTPTITAFHISTKSFMGGKIAIKGLKCFDSDTTPKLVLIEGETTEPDQELLGLLNKKAIASKTESLFFLEVTGDIEKYLSFSGLSGSPAFDMDGKVVGIVTGTIYYSEKLFLLITTF